MKHINEMIWLVISSNMFNSMELSASNNRINLLILNKNIKCYSHPFTLFQTISIYKFMDIYYFIYGSFI